MANRWEEVYLTNRNFSNHHHHLSNFNHNLSNLSNFNNNNHLSHQ